MERAAILVLSNLPDVPSAQKLADALLAGHLAACVNIGAPVESMYHWRGAIEKTTEVPVAIKTRQSLYAKVEATVREYHPYELPEVIAVPLADGFSDYIDWIFESTDEAEG